MRFEVERARDWFGRGWPLAEQVDRELAIDHRIIQSRRTGDSECDRAAGICRAGTASGNFENPQTGAGSSRGAGEALMSAAVQPMPCAVFSEPVANRRCLLGVPQHHRSAAKNFYYAFPGSAAAKRQALCAVYAFMRRCDDISDDGKLLPYERRRKLEAWLDALHRRPIGPADR